MAKVVNIYKIQISEDTYRASSIHISSLSEAFLSNSKIIYPVIFFDKSSFELLDYYSKNM